MSLDEAVERANAALANGADVAFVEAPQTMAEIESVPKRVNGPCLLNVVRGGKTPEIDLDVAERMGYAIAIVPGLLLGGIISTCDRLLGDLKQGKFPPVTGSPARPSPASAPPSGTSAAPPSATRSRPPRSNHARTISRRKCMAAARTMFEKIWQRHVVVDRDDGYTLLYIDRHLMHDGSAAGFAKLRERNMKLRRPDRGFATPDHYVRSDTREISAIADPHHRKLVEAIRTNTAESGVTLFDLGDERQGIAHVVGPEQGVTQPGLTLVCGDSHTSTHGALGALAFGIGSSEVALSWPRSASGSASPRRCASASTAPGRGRDGQGRDPRHHRPHRHGRCRRPCHRICRQRDQRLSIEGRLTVCNMSIEAGGKAGMVAPTTRRSPISRVVPLRPRRPNGTRRSPSGAPSRATKAPPSTGRSASTRRRSHRW